MKAVVMAGGEGSRLRPLTIARPKPLVPIVNKPVMGHILDLLKGHGITEVVVTLRYMSSLIQDFFDDGSTLGMKIHYVVEEVPLGTAGSIKYAASLLDEPFIIISGDALTDFDLTQIIRSHNQRQAKATITLTRVSNPQEFGVVITDGDGWVTRFLEKPGWSEVISDTVNTGIYVLEPEILDLIPNNCNFDFSLDLFPRMMKAGMPIFGHIAEGYWCDVGTIGEYLRANADMLQGRVRTMEPIGENRGGGVWVGKGVEIAPSAMLFGPIYLGNEVKVKHNVRIYGPAVVRDYSVIDSNTLIERSVLWRNNYVGENCEVRGAMVGRQCSIKPNVVVFEGAVIGDRCVLGENSVIHPNIKLWPNKEIESGSSVAESVIWGNQGRRSLFGRFGATGVVNVDLTPEFAAKFGSALGAILPKGSYVVVNRDAHRSSRMLKRALVSGLPGAGVNVWDTESVAIPVFRHYVRSQKKISAGVHVRLSPFDQRVVDIRVTDQNGLNLSSAAERSIERSFSREDFRRAFLDEIGIIDDAHEPIEAYGHDFLSRVDATIIQRANFRVVVDYSHGLAADSLSGLFNKLGVDVVPLNARVDESKLALLEAGFRANQERMAKIVTAVEANLGIQLDVGGEKLFVVDEQGRVLDDVITAALMMEVALFANPGRSVALPINMPNAFEIIADWHQSQLVRTTTNIYGLPLETNGEAPLLAFDGAGNFIFADFQPVVDGMMAAARLLEYLALRALPISEVLHYLPAICLAQAEVNCPWEKKGMVMRRLHEDFKDQPVSTIDGIKVHLSSQAWVHLAPHPDKPQFTILTEAESDEAAQRLCLEYQQLLEKLVRNQAE